MPSKSHILLISTSSLSHYFLSCKMKAFALYFVFSIQPIDIICHVFLENNGTQLKLSANLPISIQTVHVSAVYCWGERHFWRELSKTDNGVGFVRLQENEGFTSLNRFILVSVFHGRFLTSCTTLNVVILKNGVRDWASQSTDFLNIWIDQRKTPFSYPHRLVSCAQQFCLEIFSLVLSIFLLQWKWQR